jgi:hypothetical protein
MRTPPHVSDLPISAKTKCGSEKEDGRVRVFMKKHHRTNDQGVKERVYVPNNKGTTNSPQIRKTPLPLASSEKTTCDESDYFRKRKRKLARLYTSDIKRTLIKP